MRPSSAPATLASAARTESIALRAFATLESVAAAAGPLSLGELTTVLQLPKPTVFRILKLLQEAGLVRRDPRTKRFTIGTRLNAFAVDLWRNGSLRAEWHRALEDAVAATGEACHLTLLEGDQVVCLDSVEPPHPERIPFSIGSRVPLHCSASGRLFLSTMSAPDARRRLGAEPYGRFTDRTLVDFASLEPELLKIRETGIGTLDGELFEDAVAIAVPIVTQRQSVISAVSIKMKSSRSGSRDATRLLGAIRQAAERIAMTLSVATATR